MQRILSWFLANTSSLSIESIATCSMGWPWHLHILLMRMLSESWATVSSFLSGTVAKHLLDCWETFIGWDRGYLCFSLMPLISSCLHRSPVSEEANTGCLQAAQEWIISNFSRIYSLGFILVVSRDIFEGHYFSKCSDWVMMIGEVTGRVDCVYKPISLTWRATKNPSPDFVPLLEIPSLLAQIVEWWGPQMAHLCLTSPHLTSTSTKELAMMASAFP